MIEQLEQQLAHLWRLADVTGRRDEIMDHVKRHIRIVKQKPEIGDLALSIASTELAIDRHQQALKRGEMMAPQDLLDAVDTMGRAAVAHDESQQQ